MGNSGSPYLGKAQLRAARAALPIPINVCKIFSCPNNCMAASVWIFNVHTDGDACDCTRDNQPGTGTRRETAARMTICCTAIIACDINDRLRRHTSLLFLFV